MSRPRDGGGGSVVVVPVRRCDRARAGRARCAELRVCWADLGLDLYPNWVRASPSGGVLRVCGCRGVCHAAAPYSLFGKQGSWSHHPSARSRHAYVHTCAAARPTCRDAGVYRCLESGAAAAVLYGPSINTPPIHSTSTPSLSEGRGAMACRLQQLKPRSVRKQDWQIRSGVLM